MLFLSCTTSITITCDVTKKQTKQQQHIFVFHIFWCKNVGKQATTKKKFMSNPAACIWVCFWQEVVDLNTHGFDIKRSRCDPSVHLRVLLLLSAVRSWFQHLGFLCPKHLIVVVVVLFLDIFWQRLIWLSCSWMLSEVCCKLCIYIHKSVSWL